jgi:glyoxylase-like metal-dependent hydrolase (beta-lactamase superfamily II)
MSPILLELPTPYPIGTVNCYLFLEPEPTLVDCGMKTTAAWQALAQGFAAHGLRIADLKRIIITHAHVDHMGMANQIVAESGAQVWLSDLVYDYGGNFAEKWGQRVDFHKFILPFFGLTEAEQAGVVAYMDSVPAFWEAIPPENIVPFSIDGEMEIGGEQWQIIYAPGHTNTQTCFFQPESGAFLSADMLLPITPTPVIEASLTNQQKRSRGLPEYLRSLQMVEALPIGRVYPGHGKPFGEHGRIIERQRRRLAQRKGECLALVANGARTVGEIAGIMYSHFPPNARFTGVSMIVGYLDLLLDEGAVVRETVDGVWQFRVKS